MWIEIAKVMSSRSMAKDLSGTVKEIFWDMLCFQLGVRFGWEDPKDLQPGDY
ncbi:hypothetical protein NC653_015963 [Populus alba x Populus x berolinensis]|uniref:Uncharacterized protein n=1 Tax=Populus alba x Populus x berolinensis TaxID=444605 RepID=A0AAD6QLN9_9ROSI|nr:hypothetical protein NC653_015963 [Populus alba x Populus x berolinensis]